MDATLIKSKRPVGITLLAIAQVWVGIMSIVCSPIVGSPMWLGRTVEKFLYTHHRIRPFAILAEIVFLVIYAGIGVGLWKQFAWARQAEIRLIAFCAPFCIADILYGDFHLAFSLSAIVWYAVAFGGIIWYLMRPRVRAAFSCTGEV